MSNVKLLNGAEFEALIQANDVVVVDFFADWCMPCKMLAPIVDEVANGLVGKVAFAKVNIDENRDLATKYQVMSIPNVCVIKSGRLVDRLIGLRPKKDLVDVINKYVE